ncbi:signal peptidase I [Trebonia kvetii]|uniref:Signal peptidase I n=1 Tax=Trebonia kvetii TaxID=2480626 RepID=A0A6P2C106_9ACTN|nr:signal peptidase I [Trebonia kvetii]TVZ05044.1 signal peptidase I [Trebonia kvetii]
MSGNWYSGNAEEDGREQRGWILGHFIDPAEGVRSSKAVEVKWAIHPAGHKRGAWTADDQRTTLALHVSGRFRIDLTEASFTLERQGDYAVWGPGVDHSWEALDDSVVVTVRWPSNPI